MENKKPVFVIEPSLKEINNALADGHKLSDADFIIPKKGTPEAAGFDIFAQYDFTVTNTQAIFVDLGFRMDIPKGYQVEIIPRSGHGALRGLTIRNLVGLIDEDYVNNWGAACVLDSFGVLKPKIGNAAPIEQRRSIEIKRGMAFAQMILRKSVDGDVVLGSVDKETSRDGGHGSTGN